jgi:hypothetical protein
VCGGCLWTAGAVYIIALSLLRDVKTMSSLSQSMNKGGSSFALAGEQIAVTWPTHIMEIMLI